MKVQEQSANYVVQLVHDEWHEKPLRELVTKLVDGSHNPPRKQDAGQPMLSARNIENNGIVFDEYRLISEEAFKTEHARTRVSAGDVLLTIVGTIGRTTVVPDALQPIALQRSVAVLTPGPEILSKYLCYQFQSPTVQRYFEANARGTAQKGVYLKTLGQTPIQVAPLDQQKRILAEIEKQFSRLDEAVANLERVEANLKRYQAAVLKAAVEGRLVETEAERARREGRSYETGEQLLHRILETRRQWQGKGKYKQPAAPDTTNLPELPEGWVWATVDQLGATGQQAVLTGPFGSNMGKTDFQDTGVPVLTIGCLQEGGLDVSKAAFVSEEKSEELARYKLAQGDMLFSRMASVGRAGFVTQQFDGALFNYHIMRLRLERSVIDSMLFIYYVRGSKAVQDYVREVNHGATRDGINTEQLLNMPVAVPPVAEQHRIVAEVDRRLSVLRETEAQVDANLRRAGRLRQSVLGKAFTSP